MKQIKVGIVGSQFAAMLHAESYIRLPAVKIQAVASLKNSENFGNKYDIPNRYKSYKEMFDRESLDLISVCIPNFLHKEVVLAAVDAGLKAVISEKPLATKVEDAREMVEVCRENKVKLMYAEDWIFAPALIRAKQIVDEGGIGEILYIKAKESHNGSHSVYAQKKEYAGGGSLIHLGIHPVGFISYLAGSKIKEVMGMTSGGSEKNLVHHDYTVEDWAAALLTLENGIKGFIEANYITVGGMDDKIEIYGTEGNIHVDLTKGSPLHVYSRPGYGYAIEKADFTHGWTQPAVDEFMSLGYVNEMSHFVDCVLNDRNPQPGVRGEDGLTALEAVFAIYKSAAEKRLIKL
ncbi:MAG TPA: Gfo/Idh/MocA family oxidoreductase [Caldithrix abyssi]|uniref:Gfo/Idh/MocA family oxidoreductase n=1 Tax=Caldithrix abyssi TaxID=187145 RepID=A0A7V4U0F3_CALAY|nr:Gfo/Idh/MocA family oxidoreductase [Caldithrix abyssi]